jgi:hypothetical protein
MESYVERVPADVWSRIFDMLVESQAESSQHVRPWINVCRAWKVRVLHFARSMMNLTYQKSRSY